MSRQSSGSDTAVHVDGVTKRYGSVTALDDVSLPVRDGEFLSILGPSGAGKTTLLHLIAGFETPTEGAIRIDGERVSSTPPNERSVGLVFQGLALFPHLTVGENVAFPLRRRRDAPADVDAGVREALELVRVPLEYRDSPVDDLSGGQRQRVALARATVYEPTLLLLDEPLSSLDATLREEMRSELGRIHEETGLTVVHVTHDQTEALSMADRVAVLDGGSVEQLASPSELYANPESPFVAGFVGDATMLEGTVDRTSDGRGVATVGAATVTFPADGLDLREGASVRLGVRAERVLVDPASVEATNAYAGTVRGVAFEGDRTRYEVAVPGLDATVGVAQLDARGRVAFEHGDRVAVGWDVADILVYPQ